VITAHVQKDYFLKQNGSFKWTQKYIVVYSKNFVLYIAPLTVYFIQLGRKYLHPDLLSMFIRIGTNTCHIFLLTACATGWHVFAVHHCRIL